MRDKSFLKQAKYAIRRRGLSCMQDRGAARDARLRCSEACRTVDGDIELAAWLIIEGNVGQREIHETMQNGCLQSGFSRIELPFLDCIKFPVSRREVIHSNRSM